MAGLLSLLCLLLAQTMSRYVMTLAACVVAGSQNGPFIVMELTRC